MLLQSEQFHVLNPRDTIEQQIIIDKSVKLTRYDDSYLTAYTIDDLDVNCIHDMHASTRQNNCHASVNITN